MGRAPAVRLVRTSDVNGQGHIEVQGIDRPYMNKPTGDLRSNVGVTAGSMPD